MKRRFKKKIILLFIILLIIVGLLLLIIKWNSNIKRFIIGTWTTPGGTLYIFEKNNVGKMQVPLNDYDFTYKIEDGKIIIDFKDDSVFDPTYEYSIEKGNLTLKGQNGTFVFRRVKTK